MQPDEPMPTEPAQDRVRFQAPRRMGCDADSCVGDLHDDGGEASAPDDAPILPTDALGG